MSVFSEEFLRLKEERNVTLKEIADICGKDITTIFYWSAGKSKPDTLADLECLAESLQLSVHEKKELIRAYEITKYGKEEYECYEKISESIFLHSSCVYVDASACGVQRRR